MWREAVILRFGVVWSMAFQILNFLKEKLEIKKFIKLPQLKILLKARCKLSKHIFWPKLGLEPKSVC